MARRVSGLTVESRLIEVRAIGRVGDPTCVPSPDDCCGPRGTACCPTPPADVLLGTATGPVATGGGVGDFDLILVRPDPSAQVWESGPTFGSGGGTSELDVVLGCDPVFGWWLEGELTPAGQATVQFRILLFEDSAYLTGDIYHPALSGLVLVALEHPCPSGSGSGSGGSGGGSGTLTCCTELGPLTTLYAKIRTSTVSGTVGTATLNWNGTYWYGSVSVPCGITVYIRYGLGCFLEYSCDNITWWAAMSNCIGTCSPLCRPGYEIILGGKSECSPCTVTYYAAITNINSDFCICSEPPP